MASDWHGPPCVGFVFVDHDGTRHGPAEYSGKHVVSPPSEQRASLEPKRETGRETSAENSAAEALVRTLRPAGPAAYDAIVVPGYTPLDRVEPLFEIHPVAVGRLELALEDHATRRAPLILVTGGNVHPAATPVNEALQMKQWLLSRGVPPERIVVEPCARHSHTNLRNAGRYLVTHGLGRALIVTSRDQALYFGHPRTSSFDGRCLADLGYLVGDLRLVDANRVAFVPSGRVLEHGTDPLDP